MNKINIRAFLLTAALTFAALGAIVYSSCKKDACKDVTCKNGGACNDGKCSCPTGYSGTNCETSSLSFVNNTHMPVSITVNGNTTTIAKGSTGTITGSAGSAIAITATTAVTGTTGSLQGSQVSWSLTDTFPADGKTKITALDIKAGTYFFLQVVNRDPSRTISIMVVSYANNPRMSNTVAIPNDGNTYDVGYYPANEPPVIIGAHDNMGLSIKDWTNPTIPYIDNAGIVLSTQ